MAKLPLPDEPVALRAIIDDAAQIASELQSLREQFRVWRQLSDELGAIDQAEVERLMKENPTKARRVLGHFEPLLDAVRDAKSRYLAMTREPKTPCIRIRPYVDLPNDPAAFLDLVKSSFDSFLDLSRPLQAIIQLHDEASAKLASLSRPQQHGTGLPSPALGKTSVAEPAASNSSEMKAKPPRDPASRAVAAALTLRREGKPVSIRAACKAAGVDRKNLAANYPETIRLIASLAEPDRKPPSGKRDRRTGILDAVDDSEND